MNWKKLNKIIFLSLVPLLGTFLIIGCMDPGPVHYTKLPKNPMFNESNMSTVEKKEKDRLIKEKGMLHTRRQMNERKLQSLQRYGNSSERISRNIERDTQQINRIHRKLVKMANESNKSCFPEGIKVELANGNYKDISDIKEGDTVLVYDIAKDNITESVVKKVFIDENNHYYMINNSIKATSFERFLTKNDGWKRIGEIGVGDEIFNGNHYTQVKSKTKIEKDLTVYNLNIDSNHNFFVSQDGDTAYLVHNSGGGDGDGGGK